MKVGLTNGIVAFLIVISAMAGVALGMHIASGRYRVVLAKDPGQYERFFLLDSWTGKVYPCDLTACGHDPL